MSENNRVEVDKKVIATLCDITEVGLKNPSLYPFIISYDLHEKVINNYNEIIDKLNENSEVHIVVK